jgi:hypothetical protein
MAAMAARIAACIASALLVPLGALADDAAQAAPHPLASRTIVLDSPGDELFWERSEALENHHGLLGSFRIEHILKASGWERIGATPRTAPSQVSGFPFPANAYRERGVEYYFHPEDGRSAVFEVVLQSSRQSGNAYVLDKVSLRLLFVDGGAPLAIETGLLEDEHLPWHVEDHFPGA